MFYDYSLKDYNFKKYATDDDLVQKLRTGRGDLTTHNNINPDKVYFV